MAVGKEPYDKSDAASIERYAKRLDGHSLRDFVGNLSKSVRRGGKGAFGQLIEEHYFGYSPNSHKGPDFPEAGVELKTAPLKRVRRGELRAKERLVLSIINFIDLAEERDFDDSSFWHKNRLLLLMFYIWMAGQDALDYQMYLSRLWSFPEADLKIIRDDWEKIVMKVREQRAHELSERDTLYLAACTKGADSRQLKLQSEGPPAKQRAFSLKASYVNTIIERSAPGKLGPALKDPRALAAGETFEEYVIRRLSRYYGRTEASLKEEFRLGYSLQAKHRFYLLAKAMLGVTAEKVEEFEKGNVAVKTIRLEVDGHIREHMSFKQIKYKEIVRERWEDSEFHAELDRRFLLVVYRRQADGELVFERCGFWSIPQNDLEQAHSVWKDTRAKVKRGDYKHFMGASDNRVSHVRPKAKDSRDLMETPQGRREKKYCFWLNSEYIRAQIDSLAE
jgi:DNA mismatch repair protein MutH